MVRLTVANTYIIIGNGWVVRNCYLPAIRKLGCRAIATLDIESEEHGLRQLEKAAAIVAENPSVRVIVATPNHSHWPIAAALAPIARSVLVEKPMTLPGEMTDADVRRFANLSVSTPNRFRPDVARLTQLVRTGAVGPVRSIAIAWRRRNGIPRPGSWFTHRELSGGGALADLGPHVLDLGLDLLGYPAFDVVAAQTGLCDDWRSDNGNPPGPLSFDVETEANLALVTEDGCRHSFEVAWASPAARDETVIEVRGSDGSIRLETLFGFAPGATTARLSGVVTETMPLVRDPATDFARLLNREEAGEAASAIEGEAVMRAIDAAYRLAEPRKISA